MVYPEYIKCKIRGTMGLDENDESRDTEIDTLRPRAALRAVSQWELGDPDWASQILGWAEACGLRIEDK